MSSVHWERLGNLLAELLECAPKDRVQHLHVVCGDDEVLRRELQSLLACTDQADAYFEELQQEIARVAPLELEQRVQPQFQIGPYRTLRAIGHGGMGTVYLAQRVDGAFEHEVALKLLHRDMDTPQLRARFLAERQLLARLTHPHIARLLDGGVTDEGRPYFVMEHVDGVPITRYCAENQPSLNGVLRLVLDVIDAVSYLHRNLVVHRDLKPSNILVDRNGRVKLLDFGIAKLLADDDGTALTRTGERLMTPEYAAPEQLVGAPVTTATDVYSLGVLLYELLTGVRPHRHRGAEQIPLVRELPPTPSSRLRSRHGPEAESGDAEEESQLRGPVAWRRVRGDLDTICLAALRPEPEARYASAEQLGQDVNRFLNGLPVSAQKATWTYLGGKFVRRHWQGSLAVAAVFSLAVLGFVRERMLRDAAQEARSVAQQEAAKAVAVSDFLSDLLGAATPNRAQGRDVAVVEVLDQAADRIAEDEKLHAQPVAEATVRLIVGNTYLALAKHEEARAHLARAVQLFGAEPNDDPQALQALASYAVALQRLGEEDEAEKILRQVLKLRIAVLGEEHPQTLLAMTQIADVLWSQGRFDEVEALDRKTLEIKLRTLGEDHPDTIRSLNGLAGTLFNSGRYEEAAELYERAHRVKLDTVGPLHPDTMQLGSNLAAAYLELNRFSEAEPLLREVIAAELKVFGGEHGLTAMSVHNLGVVLAQEGRYAEAEEQLRRAVAIRENRAGMEDGWLYSRCYLADVLRDQGRLEEAEEHYLETLKLQRELFGAENQDSLRTACSLADLRLRQGDAAAAETMIDAQLETQVRVRGEGHPDTLQAFSVLARSLIAQQRYAGALEVAERAVAAGTEALGSEHLAVLDVVLDQAQALAGLGRLDQARELAARVLEGRVAKLGPEHPAVRQAEDLLSRL